MSAPLYPPPRPQSVGEVLDTGFRIFNVSLVQCLPYGVLAMIAGQLANVYDIVTGRPVGNFGKGDPVWWLLYALGLLITLGLWNALMLRQSAIAAGKPTSVSEELRGALNQVPWAVALMVFWIFAIAVGLMLLVLPGLYLAVALVFAWPALVLKSMPLNESIRYSLKLSRHNWWRITFVFTVSLAVLFVFCAVGIVFALIAAPVAGAADVAVVTAITTTVLAAMGAFAGPFLCALLLATFGDLQVRTEGTDLERRIAAAANS